MNRAKKIALCGIMSALSVVFLLIGAFTSMTLSASVLAAVCLIANAAFAPKNFLYVFLCYAVSVVSASFISGMYFEIVTFALLFAPFTVVKYYVDLTTFRRLFKWLIKIITFEICFAAYMLIFYFVFPESWNVFFEKSWYIWVLIVVAQGALFAYDYIFSYVVKWLKIVLPKFFRH